MTGLLYALTRWWLDVLPVDHAGRRCCDETLADWRKEAAKATGRWAAVVVSVRAMFAVVRCVAGVSLREVALIRQSGVPTRVFLWTVAYVSIVAVIVQLSPNIWRVSAISRIYAQVALVASFLPIAVLLATGLGAKRRPMPGVGLALVALLVGFPLLGWGAPMANRAFLDANPMEVSYPGHPEKMKELRPWKPGEGLSMAMDWQYSEVGLPSPPRPFSNDLTLGQLRGKIADGPDKGGWPAIRWLSFFGAYLSICALVPILTSLLRRRRALVRYGVVATTTMMLLGQASLQTLGSEFSLLWSLGAYWLPVAWMSLFVVAAARRDAGFQIANNQ